MNGINEKPITKNFRGTKEINHRTVYHINASKYRSDLLVGVYKEPRTSNNRKKSVKNVVGTGDGKSKNYPTATDGFVEKVYQNQKDDSIHINISVHAEEDLEKNISRSAVDEADDASSLHTCASNNLDAISLEKRRKSQIKFQLASALLNLEKEEGNDYGFLEKYLQTKFDTFQQEECYNMPNDVKQEKVLLPSVRSLHMNSFEDLDTPIVEGITDKSKSDTNCLKHFVASVTESDLEIGEGNKSGWSSMNNMSDKEGRGEGEEDLILPSRPKTSAAMLSTSSKTRMMEEPVGRVLNFRSSSKLADLATPPATSQSVNTPALIREPSSEKYKARKGILMEPSGKVSTV